MTKTLAVQATGLVKQFGALRAVDGIDLEVSQGEILGVLGPNGAGKTTMLSMLATLLPIDAGEARIFGVDVAREPHRVRQLVGVTGQYASVDEDLPVDELKLDRSFAARVTTDARSAAIVRSTVDLAHALGLQVVAEGIEDRQTLDAVERFGCDYAQGYYFSRPVPAAAFAAAVRLAKDEPGARAFPLAS
jgi:ABC-2 type transport system ATP-binding protein